MLGRCFGTNNSVHVKLFWFILSLERMGNWVLETKQEQMWTKHCTIKMETCCNRDRNVSLLCYLYFQSKEIKLECYVVCVIHSSVYFPVFPKSERSLNQPSHQGPSVSEHGGLDHRKQIQPFHIYFSCIVISPTQLNLSPEILGQLNIKCHWCL